jgi:hypothetical protein
VEQANGLEAYVEQPRTLVQQYTDLTRRGEISDTFDARSQGRAFNNQRTLQREGQAFTASQNAAERAAQTGRPPTDAQNRAQFFYSRAEPASKLIDRFDSIDALDALAGKGGMLRSWASSAEGRQLTQAGKDWAMAVLRQDSGGAISDEEMEFYFDTYLPRPGDDQQTLTQKRAARQTVTQGLLQMAGPAGSADPYAGQAW